MSSVNFMNMENGKQRTSAAKCCLIWAGISTVAVIALTITVIVLGARLNANTDTIKIHKISWCTVNTDEKNKCMAWEDSVVALGLSPVVQCVYGGSVDRCVSMVENGEADAMTIDGGQMFQHRDKVMPVMAEDYGDGDATYWAVAVVKKSDTTTFFTKAGLKNKVSCHTGYQKTAGWIMPMGAMTTKGFLNGCGNALVNSSLSLFSKMCAPGGKDVNPKLCSACKGTCQKNCIEEDYCGYSGAFRCLAEGGDVAFVKHTTVFQNTNGQNDAAWAATLSSSDYELLCTDGSRAPLSAYAECSLGKVPSHAVVMSKKTSAENALRVKEMLEAAQLRFGPHSDISFKLFSGKVQDLLFKSSTKRLLPLTDTCTTESFLGSTYLNSQLQLTCSSPNPDSTSSNNSCLLYQSSGQDNRIRWCVTSAAELNKCNKVLATEAQNVRPDITVSCTKASSVQQCALLLSTSAADLVVMDGGEIYTAGAAYYIHPLAAEYYGSGSASSSLAASYYAVAAIKKTDNTTRFTKAGLRGKRTCHTGFGKTAGWNVPVGLMEEKGFLTARDSCDLPQALSNFLSSACVPGIQNSEEHSEIKDKLCSACPDACTVPGNYSGYSGALRCLDDNKGDVAFIKHTTIKEADRGNYNLLCQDGTIQSPDQYQACHLAIVPSHALMISPGRSPSFRETVWQVLSKMQESSSTQMFSSNGGSDLIFKDSTSCLLKVDSTCSWKSFLGQDYFNAAQGLACANNVASTTVGSCSVTPGCNQPQ